MKYGLYGLYGHIDTVREGDFNSKAKPKYASYLLKDIIAKIDITIAKCYYFAIRRRRLI